MLIIDIVIVILGIYLLVMAFKMKKTNKVEKFLVPEETMQHCKDEKGFSIFLWKRMLIFSAILIIGGGLMVLGETVVDFGAVAAVFDIGVAIGLIWFYKELSNGRVKFC